jgi:hypothetical protein
VFPPVLKQSVAKPQSLICVLDCSVSESTSAESVAVIALLLPAVFTDSTKVPVLL